MPTPCANLPLLAVRVWPTGGHPSRPRRRHRRAHGQGCDNVYVHLCHLEPGVSCVSRSRGRYRPVTCTRVVPSVGARSAGHFATPPCVCCAPAAISRSTSRVRYNLPHMALSNSDRPEHPEIALAYCPAWCSVLGVSGRPQHSESSVSLRCGVVPASYLTPLVMCPCTPQRYPGNPTAPPPYNTCGISARIAQSRLGAGDLVLRSDCHTGTQLADVGPAPLWLTRLSSMFGTERALAIC